LTMAQERRAYILTDRGTFLARRGDLELTVAFEGDSTLWNPYAVIAVNPQRHPGIRHAAAAEFIAWMTRPRAQALIQGFRVDGEQLFHLFGE